MLFSAGYRGGIHIGLYNVSPIAAELIATERVASTT